MCLLLDCIFVHQRLPHERVHLLNSTCFLGGKPLHDFCFLLFNRSYSDVHGLRKTEMTYSSFWLCRKLGGWNLSCCFCFESLNNCKSALTTFQLCNTCPTLSTTSQNEIKDQRLWFWQLRWRFFAALERFLEAGDARKKKEICTLLQDVGGEKCYVLCFKTRANSWECTEFLLKAVEWLKITAGYI